MPFTFFIPKEYRRSTADESQVTVPDNYHGDASKTLSDQFGIPLDTVESWSASNTAKGTPIADVIQKLQTFGRPPAFDFEPELPFGGVQVQPKDEFLLGPTGTANDASFFPTAETLADARARLFAAGNFVPDFSSGNLAGQVEPFDIIRKAQIEAQVAQVDALMEAGETLRAKTMWEQMVEKYGADRLNPEGGWMGGESTFPTEMPSSAGSNITGSAGFADESAADSGLLGQMWGENEFFGFQPTGAATGATAATGEWAGSPAKEAWTPNKWTTERFDELGAAASAPDWKAKDGDDDSLDKTFRGERTTDQIIAMFGKKSALGDVSYNEDGIETINPLLAQLLEIAAEQNGKVLMAEIEAAHDAAAKAIAEFNRAGVRATAAAQGASDVEVARLMANADTDSAEKQKSASKYIAEQRRAADEYVARYQKTAAIAKSEAIKFAAIMSAEWDSIGQTAQADAIKAAATSQAGAIKAAADSARRGQETAANYARRGQEAAALSAAGAVTGAATSQADAVTEAAKTAAAASGPFGFLTQGGSEFQEGVGSFDPETGRRWSPQKQLEQVYDLLNAPGLAAAEASRVGAQGNVFGLAAGQVKAGGDPLTIKEILELQASQSMGATAQAAAAKLAAQDNPYGYAAAQVSAESGEREFRPNELAQIGANTPAAFAARGQEAAARAGATGFGALLTGDTGVNQQADEILRAQAANNPYAIQQLGRGWSDTAAADQNLRIDQILRGGLTPQQRIAEINASQAGQNFANQLNFMSNPSAVGFATERGLLGGGNNQILQDINNSPEGNVPGSLFGFNSPSAAGAGGGETTNLSSNPNLSTMRNWSPEDLGFAQGGASARGQTPQEFIDQAQSFTPQGVG